MLYGAETWVTTKQQEARIEVNEMRMLRRVRGVTRKDKIGKDTFEERRKKRKHLRR